VADLGDPFVPGRKCNQFFRIRQRGRQRLFDQHVNPDLH